MVWHSPNLCRGMFDKKMFEKMKDGAWLVNTARGAIVDKDDVAEALKSGKLAGITCCPEPASSSN